MKFRQIPLQVTTAERGAKDITELVGHQVRRAGAEQGVVHVFLHHTSASLMLCENSDEQVRRDLEAFLARLVPDGDPLFRHDGEGVDDMPAHVRSVLTQNHVTLPIDRGNLALGRWQGLFLYEHRLVGSQRKLTLNIFGMADTDSSRD